MTEGDYPFVRELYHFRDNAKIASSLIVEDADFIAAVRALPWSTPMVLLHSGEEVASALIAAADTQHLHGRIILMAMEPRRCTQALALYLRQVFWSHPFHRLYSALPAMLPQAGSYAELLVGCGFVAEGRLVEHLKDGMRLLDIDLFGLLRNEFDAWSGETDPAWTL
jgi:hypothetical protein